MLREPDKVAARELYLFIKNDGQLYRNFREPIEKNLIRKKKKGTYNEALARKAYARLMNEGAKKYARQFASPRDWNRIFTPDTRRAAARMFEREFSEEYKVGGFGLGRPAFKIRGSYCKEEVMPKSHFDPRSFRWVARGTARIMIGCPRGKWDDRAERCRVGTRAHVLLTKRDRCPRGAKRVRR